METLLGLRSLFLVCLSMIPFMWLGLLSSYGRHKTVPSPNRYEWAGITLVWPAFFTFIGGASTLLRLTDSFSIEKLAIGLLLFTWGVLLLVLTHKFMSKSEEIGQTENRISG